MLAMGLWMIASIRTVAMAATSIAREKEARTWPILLGTTLDDWQIIRGKAVAVLWRNLPLWLAMIVSFIGYFILINLSSRAGGPGGPSFWLYILGGLISFTTHVALLISVGMYFSVRLRSATAAVISSIGAVLGLFIFQRFFLMLIIRVLTVSMGSPYAGVILFYLVPSLVYIGAGLLLIWRAKCRLRKDIF
jgi:ABC-type transport system involved in multi-copper enzyme maturation permease subunit